MEVRSLGLMLAAATLLGAASGCHLMLDGEPGAGIGAPCEEDSDCQGARCIDEVCAAPCSAAADCPAPSVCTRAGLCQLPLRVGFVYAGDPQLEEWSRAHDLGREAAMAALPYLEAEVSAGKLFAPDATAAIEDFISSGVQVVVTTSPALRDVAAIQAAAHPEIKFLVHGAPQVAENSVGFSGRMYQAAYLAGYAAARRSATGRLGMLGSLVTPTVVQYINAFTTGARRARPEIAVEVRWIGYWHDTMPPDAQGRTQERVLTEALLASGCDVIAHQVDNGIPVTTVAEQGGGAKAIGNNVEDACPEGVPSCLGATFFRWAPIYTSLLDGLHRSRWTGGEILQAGIAVSPSNSVVNFGLSPAAGAGDLAIEVDELLQELAVEGGGLIPFTGPLCSTGQRDSDGDGAPDCLMPGESASEQELSEMCWFVEGILEKEDPDDPSSADRPALVPSEGDCIPTD